MAYYIHLIQKYTLKKWHLVETTIFFKYGIIHCTLENGADLCVNEDQYVSEYRVSLAERKKERKKEEGEKSNFDSVWFSM